MAAKRLVRSKAKHSRLCASPPRHLVERLESRLLLSAVSWISTTSGDFATPGNWSTGQVPGAGDDVTIDQGAGVTVMISGTENEDINSLTTNSPVLITGNLTVETGNVTLNGATLTVDDSQEQGNLFLDGAGTLGGTGNFILDGAGQIVPLGSGMTIGSGITITEGGSSVQDGTVGNQTGATVVNDGTINAGSLDLDVADLTNNGTLAVADGGDLTLIGPCTLGAASNVNVGININGAGVCEAFDLNTASLVTNLGGTLNIALDDGFIPTQGAQYSVVFADAGNFTGSFAAINGLSPSGATFTTSSSSVGVTLTASQGAPTGMSATTLGLQSSEEPSADVGDGVTFTASLGTLTDDEPTATGEVSFFANGALLGAAGLLSGGFSQLNTNISLAPGAYQITAQYSGDSFYSSTSAGEIPLTVNGSSTTTPTETIGGLDPTFGTNGLASHEIGLTSTSDLLLQPNGQSVIIGTVGASPSGVFGLTRYNADGSLDTDFGNSGVTDTSIGDDDQAAAGFLLPDGDILVAGTVTMYTNGQAAGSQFALAEYTSDGVLDTTFGGGNGYVLTSFSSSGTALSNDVAHAIVVSADGEIFVGGSSDAGGNGPEFAIAAYNADGSVATNFGTAGQVLLDFNGDDSVASLALLPKNGLLAAGSTTNSGTGVGSVALASLLASGDLNTHFGDKGKVVTNVVGGVDDAAASVTVDSKGRIVVGGSSATGSASAGTLSSDFLLLRYTSTGKLDHFFNRSGTVIASFNQPAAVSKVLVDADGTIIASGKTAASLGALNTAELELAVARYTSTGQLDTSFNQTGQAIFNLASAGTDALQAAGAPVAQPARPSPFDTTSELMAEFNQLTQSDQGVSAMTSTGELLDVGNSDANTVEAAIITMGIDLAATVLSTVPSAVLGGAKGTISVKITEIGNELATGAITLDLSAATSQTATGQSSFQSFPEQIKLKEGQAKTFKLRFSYPSMLADGNYYVQATIDTGSLNDLNPSNNTAATAMPVDIAAPFVDLAATDLSTPVFVGSKAASVSFTVKNDGNIPTPSTLSSIEFLASPDGTLASATMLTTIPYKANLKPSKSGIFKTKLAVPTNLSGGMYYLLALVDPGNVFNDPNTSNNLVVSSGEFTVG